MSPKPPNDDFATTNRGFASQCTWWIKGASLSSGIPPRATPSDPRRTCFPQSTRWVSAGFGAGCWGTVACRPSQRSPAPCDVFTSICTPVTCALLYHTFSQRTCREPATSRDVDSDCAHRCQSKEQSVLPETASVNTLRRGFGAAACRRRQLRGAAGINPGSRAMLAPRLG